MAIVGHTRRWLLRLLPATAAALSVLGASQADVPQSPKTNYRVMLISLIPHLPQNKKGTFLDVKAGERVAIQQYLDLPLVLEIEPHRLAHLVVDRHGKEIRDYYTVRLLDVKGKEITEKNIADATTAVFVDQRLLVHFSVA